MPKFILKGSKEDLIDSRYRIMPALTKHLPLLPEIERQAARCFPAELLPTELENETVTLAELKKARKRGLLWVAVLKNLTPVGFIIAKVLDDDLLIKELDVLPDYQAQGIGKALMVEVCTHAYFAGFTALVLTTFRDIPWNAPWYQRLGFRILDVDEMGFNLQTILKNEAERGLDPEKRVAMRLNLSDVNGL